MARVITAVYDSKDKIRNTMDDLVSTGIPREEIQVDEEKSQIKVIAANVSVPEIHEILQRHQPRSLD